jgi:hypothetical protein
MKKILGLGFVVVLGMVSFHPQAQAETFTLKNMTVESLATLPTQHLNLNVAGIQATNLRVADNITYVTYNSAGTQAGGAVEAIDISDIRNPRSIGLLQYADTEFADLALVGNTAYLVGQISNAQHQGAVLKIVDISNPKKMQDLGNVYMNGYAATSIHVRNDEAIVSVGDNLGVEIFSLNDNKSQPVLKREIPLLNSLYAVSYRDSYLALGGNSQTTLFAYGDSSATPTASLNISSKVSASPARFQLADKYGFVNDQSSGLSIVDLSKLDKNVVSLASHLAVPGTGNGLDVYHDQELDVVFLAQGEDGLYIVDTQDKTAPINLGNLDFHYTGESTNQVKAIGKYECGPFALHHYLLVANGTGGFRTFELHRQQNVKLR